MTIVYVRSVIDLTKKIALALLVAIPIFSMASCATLYLQPYQPPGIDGFHSSKEYHGLVIAAEPILDPRKQVNIFGKALRPLDILPVSVILKNMSSNTSFLVSDSFLSNANEKLSSVDPRENPLHLGLSAGGLFALGFILLIPPGTLFSVPVTMAAAAKENRGNEVNYALITSALFPTTIEPGEVIHGFLYYKVPGSMVNSRKWSLSMKLVEWEGNNSDEAKVVLTNLMPTDINAR